MKKHTLIIMLLVLWAPSFAQRNLVVKETTEGINVFTEKDTEVDKAGGSQAGAIFSCPLALSLQFSSNVDRQVEVMKTEERGELRLYFLRFIVGRYRGASYDNRTLEITAAGFLPYRLRLQLQPSESKSFEVFDPNATVGVGCYFEHLNKGNNFFENTRYDDAKTEYFLALECSERPEENDLSMKIENADAARYSKTAGDMYYNEGNYMEAKQEYERLRGLNPNDKYPAERIAICDIRIPNLPRTIRVKVTDANGENMSDVAFSVDEYKVDKQGNLVLQNGKPQKGKGFIQATAIYSNGVYSITAKSVNQTLALRKYIDGKTEYYDEVQIPLNADTMEIKLTKTKMTSAEKWDRGFGIGKKLVDELTK